MLLKVNCLPNAVGKQPSIPLINLGVDVKLMMMMMSNCKIYSYSIEVGTLKLISNIKNFCFVDFNSSLTNRVRTEITKSVISSSFTIFAL